ncbi:MAG: ParB/RepB/Spo0J family partition protein [Elusimicrobia bacterium]|nr:ParB/RepB/Spo0J family partition protein [Elusimicrobiota bacterium]
MAARASRLGRGLDVLLPSRADSAKPQNGAVEIPIESIEANPFQGRKNFNDARLKSLADSIKQIGLLEPVLVNSKPSGGYALIAGERRLRAAKSAGLKTIPAVIKNMGSKDTALAGLVENVQRQDLNPLELARTFERMTAEFGMTHEEIAACLGFSRPRVSNLIRLLNLPAEIQEYLIEGHLNEGQARALLSFDDEAERLRVAKEIAQGGGWSVRDIERKKHLRQKDPNIITVEKEMEKSAGTRVKIAINSKKKSGWVSIYFSDLEHFDRIRKRLEAK